MLQIRTIKVFKYLIILGGMNQNLGPKLLYIKTVAMFLLCVSDSYNSYGLFPKPE